MAGVLDPSYQGELKVLLLNLGDETISFKAKDRVAQLILKTISLAKEEKVESFPFHSETTKVLVPQA